MTPMEISSVSSTLLTYATISLLEPIIYFVESSKPSAIPKESSATKFKGDSVNSPLTTSSWDTAGLLLTLPVTETYSSLFSGIATEPPFMITSPTW